MLKVNVASSFALKLVLVNVVDGVRVSSRMKSEICDLNMVTLNILSPRKPQDNVELNIYVKLAKH